MRRDDGAEIAWYSSGSGPAVLLVMGLAYPAASWFRQVPVLAEQHRVLTVDNRGAGLTGDVVGAPYTVELMAADCVAVLDAAGEERAHVVGISMGGLIAQELGLSHPERVRSLALLATHAGLAHASWDPEAIALLQARATMTAADAAEASIPFNYGPTTPRERIEQDWATRLGLAASAEGYAAQGGTALWSGLERLPSMAVPTLVVHGDADRLVLPANGRQVAGAIPGARLELVTGANHVLTTDQPETVNALLLAWFAEQAG